MKLRELLGFVRRACEDYDMIDDGDKIAVGVSGGKDSLSLLAALKALSKFYPKRFEVCAVSVSLGLPGCDFSHVREFCEELGVEFSVVDTNIGHLIFDVFKEKNPCSLCAKMRRGALYAEAKRLGCNKAALGHNRDDVNETLILSLFYEGRIHTFSPVTLLDKSGICVIRPLIYVEERDVISFARRQGLPVLKSPCPADGYTKRQEAKEFIRERARLWPDFPQKIFGAIQRGGIDGWKEAGHRQSKLPRGDED